MFKKENEWEIGDVRENHRNVEINGEIYYMEDQVAGLTHAILLLVDAINDKKIN